MNKREELIKKLPLATKVQKSDILLLKDLQNVFEEHGLIGSIKQVTFVMPPKTVDPMAGINCWKFCFSGPMGEVICTWECWRKGEG